MNANEINDFIAELDKSTLKANLQSAEANLASSKAELTYQKANYDRIKSLYERQVISDVEMEQAQYQYDKAKAEKLLPCKLV